MAHLRTQCFLVECLGEGSEGVDMHLASQACKCLVKGAEREVA